MKSNNQAMPGRLRRNAGFTLIELMIAVVIVAILAAVAYPSYQDHLRKGRRAAAQAFMMEVANREQQYLLDARSYTTALSDLKLLPVPTEVSQFYTVTIAAASPPPTYTITATPVAGSTQVSDGVLTLTHEGSKTRNGQPGW
jgi:type IV pilus assembly protein PilE